MVVPNHKKVMCSIQTPRILSPNLLCGSLGHAEEVTVTRVGDGHDTARTTVNT